jgi:hypothetical protein
MVAGVGNMRRKLPVIVFLSSLALLLLSPIAIRFFRSCTFTYIRPGYASVGDIAVPANAWNNECISTSKDAGLYAEALLKSREGWLVLFNKPFTISYDEPNKLWVVLGSRSWLGGVLGAWDGIAVGVGSDG